MKRAHRIRSKRSATFLRAYLGPALGRLAGRLKAPKPQIPLPALLYGICHWLGGHWEVALALLTALVGVPGWLDKPLWARPIALGLIVLVGIYGKGRTERDERKRSQEERMAFAVTASDLLREERERDAAKRDRDAEAEEVEALEAEIRALTREDDK